MPEPPIIAVDPGRDKCGLAVVASDGTVLDRAIVDVRDVGAAVADLLRAHGAEAIVLGERTGSRAVRAAIAVAASDAQIIAADEHMTTLEARRRYWRENPPRRLQRLIPEGLRVPPEPIDDWAAVILAERHLGLSER